MGAEDLILISVDDHVVEPPTLFDRHLPAKWKDRAPRIERLPDGSDIWRFDGKPIINVALNAVVGRPPEEYGMEPTSFEQIRRGTWDLPARIEEMNANGVLASLCFPSFPGLCGATFARCEDRELGLAVLQAYNDWHVDDWCGTYPERFIPLGLLPLWDPQAMATEVRRLARKGCHAVSFTESPQAHGFPSWHTDHWDPFFKACNDEGTVVCIHIGSGVGMQFTSMDAPVDVMITTSPIAIVNAAADLLWSPVLRRYPDIRIALSEGGIGWIPYFLERADYVHEHHHRWTHQDFGGKRPSDVWREHIISCFIEDPVGVRNRHAVGIDTITWECDYPHSDTTWPESPEKLWAQIEAADCSAEDIAKMTHLNAMRFFSFDPFKHRPAARCTAGALRAESPNVDLSVKSVRGSKPPTDDSSRPVTSGDVVQQLASLFEK